MLGRIKCLMPKWAGGGHKRGKRSAKDDTPTHKAYRCPRCTRLKTYKRDEHAST